MVVSKFLAKGLLAFAALSICFTFGCEKPEETDASGRKKKTAPIVVDDSNRPDPVKANLENVDP